MNDDDFATEDYGMTPAIQRLNQLNIDYEMCSPYHLKSGILNYYPSTGTITIDGRPTPKVKGIEAFINQARKLGHIRPAR